ncbi:MAG: glycosyltransferase family protein [Nitrospirae bacterium]|nr:glycosyltransferase family protein [Nitrospirota bacterium]
MPKTVVAIIQARMGSKRLPGKSMMPLAGKPLLYRFIERVKRSKTPEKIVLATTERAEDNVLVRVAEELGISVFRGSEDDLVDRYYQAAKEFKADTVVRLCADNPVVEPEEIDRIIRYHLGTDNDFSSNTHNINGNGYPDGLGAEVYNFSTIEKLWKITKDPTHREHPHSYIYEHRADFKVGTVTCPPEFRRPELRLDVNTEEEYQFLSKIYEYWYPQKKDFHITDIIQWYDKIYRCAHQK